MVPDHLDFGYAQVALAILAQAATAETFFGLGGSGIGIRALPAPGSVFSCRIE